MNAPAHLIGPGELQQYDPRDMICQNPTNRMNYCAAAALYCEQQAAAVPGTTEAMLWLDQADRWEREIRRTARVNNIPAI